METFTRAGLTFDVTDRGPRHGEPVVLLHGFPQDRTAYDDVTERLTANGLRTLVPDQRGYSPGARPTGRRAYRIDELVADVLALLDAAGVDRAHVVGHDWGGAVAWALAANHPDRVGTLTAVSTPHPVALRQAMLHSSQLLRSWYITAFQVPRLPERSLLDHGGRRLRSALRRSGLPAPRTDHYVQRMLRPGALTGALAWYRALAAGPPPAAGPVPVPTAYVHGLDDPFFARYAAAATVRHVTAPFRSVPVRTGHWVPEVRPDAVADAVLATLGR